ncbi:histidinol-phosphatase HisJ [Bacillus sp. 1P06AnD]|uniref:histidinol-phosphatase HisJ n=1 Tax=Bacillus sp. 1P06AnD TaxID=3132208 RepID=UPI0039A373DF
MLKADSHVHSPYCPHGTPDPFAAYLEQAISYGLEEITFTEHAPLPRGFNDPTPLHDSAMRYEQIQGYITELQALQKEYSKRITILIGMEFDYIDGYEEEIKKLMDEVGPYLNDSILSVHFLKETNDYFCIDYSADHFGQMINRFGSADRIYSSYFETVRKSISADLGTYKPIRIGHMTLAHKFQHAYPPSRPFTEEERQIVQMAKENGMALDYNGAGTVKPLCLETYPPEPIVKYAMSIGVPLVFGSDAHSAQDLCQGSSKLAAGVAITKPSALTAR